MDVSLLNPFIEGLISILGQFGVTDIKRVGISKKDSMMVEMDVTAVVGIAGEVKGNVGYSLNKDTALKIVSAMMMGMPVSELDSMGLSAVSEIANMITGTAMGLLSSSAKQVMLTPPSIVVGSEIMFIISSVDTIEVLMDSSIGKIAVNIGLEI